MWSILGPVNGLHCRDLTRHGDTHPGMTSLAQFNVATYTPKVSSMFNIELNKHSGKHI